jgi:anti-sigma factor RsiW
MRALLGRIVGPMLTCRELIDFLWRYVEDDLSPEERKAFDRHLALCPSCRAYLDSYRKTIALGKAAYADPSAEVPAEVPDEIVAGILAARRARS